MFDYLHLLLLIHIGGAILGFGPTFAFSVLGPLARDKQGPEGVAILEGIVAIERKLVIPIAVVTQPLTGVLLIFESGYNNDFFSHIWLWVSILIFAVALYTAIFLQTPTIEKMIKLARGGQAQGEEFGSLAARMQMTGPLLGVMLLVIIVLMILKPGT